MIPVWVAGLAVIVAYIVGMASFVIFDYASEQHIADRAAARKDTP